MRIEHFVPIKRLSQLWEMLCKEAYCRLLNTKHSLIYSGTNYTVHCMRVCTYLGYYKFVVYKIFVVSDVLKFKNGFNFIISQI